MPHQPFVSCLFPHASVNHFSVLERHLEQSPMHNKMNIVPLIRMSSIGITPDNTTPAIRNPGVTIELEPGDVSGGGREDRKSNC